jgi:hypothetical protein
MELTDAKIDFWIKHNYNVLMTGKYGVGKTAQIMNGFNRNGLKWKYYSTPTMDPWVDFIGVPEKVVTPEGNKYLELIQPKDIAADEIEAFYFDEFNRGKGKIRDAVLELIQFKTINGRPFKNLRMIWAAINPDKSGDNEDDEYFVEKLDPAQRDRFQVHVYIDYAPNLEFFTEKFDVAGSTAVEWWHNLPDNSKHLVSPRRLEYTLDMFNKGGDIKDVLPANINHTELVTQLKNGSFVSRLATLFTSQDNIETEKQLKNENFFNGTIEKILNNPDYLKYFSQHFPNEKFTNLLLTNEEYKKYVFSDEQTVRNNLENLNYIIDANIVSKKVIKEIKDELKKYALWKDDPIDTYVDKYYNEFMAGDVDSTNRMRMASILQQTEIDDMEYDMLIKLNVVIGLIASNVQQSWGALKIGYQKIKARVEKLGKTYQQLHEDTKNDPLFKQKGTPNLFKLEKKLDEAYNVLKV